MQEIIEFIQNYNNTIDANYVIPYPEWRPFMTIDGSMAWHWAINGPSSLVWKNNNALQMFWNHLVRQENEYDKEQHLLDMMADAFYTDRDIDIQELIPASVRTGRTIFRCIFRLDRWFIPHSTSKAIWIIKDARHAAWNKGN